MSLIAVLALLIFTIFPSNTQALSLADVAAYGVARAPPAKGAVESRMAKGRSFAVKGGGKGKSLHGGKRVASEVQMRRRTGKGVRRLVVGEDGHY